MSGARFVFPSQQAADAAGIPYVGGQVFFYATGTSTPQNTYQDAAFTIANPNPVILDAAGRGGNIFMLPSPNYRVVLQDVNGAVVYDMDPVGPGAGGGGVAGIQAGMIMIWGGPTLPAGWFWCDGSEVSRTVYSTLFAAIGTAHGAGDGATTFNLPDLRGRAPVGRDDMGTIAANRITFGVSGISGNALGAAGGDQSVQSHNHTLTDPQHTHTLTDPGHNHTVTITWWGGGGGTPGYIGQGSGHNGTDDWTTTTASTGITIGDASTGITIANYGNGASQNVQPSAIVNFIIWAG